jgi:hypothetical protein
MPSSDTDPVVLFIDILGFASLVLRFENAISDLEPITHKSRENYDIGTLAHVFTRFHIELDDQIRQHTQFHMDVATFSDSAFVSVPSLANIVGFSRGLMRRLLGHCVPVRMGLARGSFRTLRTLSDRTRTASINTAQFL